MAASPEFVYVSRMLVAQHHKDDDAWATAVNDCVAEGPEVFFGTMATFTKLLEHYMNVALNDDVRDGMPPKSFDVYIAQIIEHL